MVKRPDGISAFEFSVLAGLRAAQLGRGCTPRVDPRAKLAVTAQWEIAELKVMRAPNFVDVPVEPVVIVPIAEPIET